MTTSRRLAPLPLLLIGLAALLALALGGVLLYSTPAQAQTTPRILVSNSAQGNDDSADTSGNDHAQLFHTAGATNGYTLTGVIVVSEDAEGDAFDVEICAEDGSTDEFPSTTASDCTALTAPGSFTAGNLEFTHAGLALTVITNYVVVIKPRSSANVTLDSTTSAGEDSSGLTGWSIKDYFYWNNSGTWTNQGRRAASVCGDDPCEWGCVVRAGDPAVSGDGPP